MKVLKFIPKTIFKNCTKSCCTSNEGTFIEKCGSFGGIKDGRVICKLMGGMTVPTITKWEERK